MENWENRESSVIVYIIEGTLSDEIPSHPAKLKLDIEKIFTEY